jgi:hypothetical protein
VPRLPRKTTLQLAWQLSKRNGFSASPIDKAPLQENQRLETRHVGAERRSFCARLPPIFYHFRHVIKQIGMSQSARPAAQNDITTCLKTFEKERFCNFPHRHGEATGKPETRDETHGAAKRAPRTKLPQIFTIGNLWKG